MPEGTVACKRA